MPIFSKYNSSKRQELSSNSVNLSEMVLRSLSQKLLNLHEALSHQEGFMMMSSIINFTKDFMHFGNKFLSNSNKTDRSKILAYLRKFEPKGLLSSNFLIIPIINF